ncbi:hypothetical protein Tco_0554478, partial [Tanacetum coccineum]
MYVDGHVDIFDMVDIDLFNVVALNRMVVQLGYTRKSERLFYNYLRPLTSLDEGLATIEEIMDERGSIAIIEHRSEKILLLTWHDSSEPTKEPVCDYVTPRSLPQHDSSTPCKDSICESITPRCMPHCMLTPPTDESIITYTQLSGVQGVDTQDHVMKDVMRQLLFEETELDGGAGFGDVVGSGMKSSGLSHDESFGVYDLDSNLNENVDLNVRTQEPIMEEVIVEDYVSSEEDDEHSNGQKNESAPSADDDDEDDDFLVDEENEIVEPEVDVHLFGISMDVPFDKISVTNIVLDDVLEGEDVDVINTNGFDNDLSNDNETSKYRRRRLDELSREMEEVKDIVYLHFIESRRNLKLYKNDSVKVRARYDRKVPVYTMSQGTGPTGPNHDMEAPFSGLSGPNTKSKKRKNIGTNDDSQACSSALDAHDTGDLCPWVL